MRYSDDILSADNSKLFLVRQKSADGCGILTEFFKNDYGIPMGILIGKCGCLDLLLRQEKSKHACALGIILRFKWSHHEAKIVVKNIGIFVVGG